MKKAILITLLCGMSVASIYASPKEAITETFGMVDVFIPAAKGKLPVVFLAHNGGATKEAWGDFPQELANAGYAVVNMGWTNSSGGNDFRKNIETVKKQYGKRIDFKRAAFIGGCHGCVKLLSIMDSKLSFTPKALVFLSLSETNSAPNGHAPILGAYATKDHLGNGYVATQIKVYETILSDPKKVIVMDTTQHGNEFITDPETKVQIRGEIQAWLKELL